MEPVKQENEIIRDWTHDELQKINALQRAMGIKHHRKRLALPITAQYKFQSGDIRAISFKLNKGLIMTHKGKGKYPDNRVEKPFFNQPMEVDVPVLADALGINWGDKVTTMLIQ